MSAERSARERLGLLPPIRRARLWRLYAEDRAGGLPQRFLDMWMDDGRCILGAKGSGIGTIAKAAIDTGLTRPFPSVREARLEKSLLARYPAFAALRVFRNEDAAIAAAVAVLPEGARLELLRPFAEHFGAPPADAAAMPQTSAPRVAMPRVAMPRLPCPPAFAPGILLFADEKDASGVRGDLVPPLLLACAHRALGELDRFASEYCEALWRRTDRRLKPHFERRGPYLYARATALQRAGGYDGLFAAALGAGVLLSPDPDLPSIVPGDFDDGELARLAKALEAKPSGAAE